MGWEEIKRLKENALKPKEKKTYRIPAVSEKRKKKLQQEKENGTDIGLDKWFEVKMATSLRRCENCGESLAHYNELDWRGSQHHVLDKALYPSVACNQL